MKYNSLTITILFTLILLAPLSEVKSQQCCPDPNRKFAEMGNARAFRAEHELPEDIDFMPEHGHIISFDTPDGRKANAFFVPAPEKTNNWLIVIHEWWGLNDHIKKESEKLWKDLGNVNVLALDMYDGKVADNREDASSYMQGLSRERAFAIIAGALNYIGSDARLATIGWCFGGGWSLQTAIEGGKRTVGCVMYYGMPEEDISRLKKLNSDVLGIFALQDQWINPEVVGKFETNMENAGKTLRVANYDADHAFANPSSPRYREETAKNAYLLTLEYLKKSFGGR